MPLIKSSSDSAFRSNVAAEIGAGKPQDQALAIAYRIRREKRRNGGRLNFDLGGGVDDSAAGVPTPLPEDPFERAALIARRRVLANSDIRNPLGYINANDPMGKKPEPEPAPQQYVPPPSLPAGMIGLPRGPAPSNPIQPKVGEFVGNVAAETASLPKRYVEANMSGFPPSENPAAVDLSTDVAMALTGLPAFGSAVPAAALGSAAKGLRAAKVIRPATENLRDVADANFLYGRIVGNKNIPITDLNGTLSPSTVDANRVSALAKAISSPQGYLERLIVDDAGNVIEGQHRLAAMQKLGIQNVPVTQIEDLGRNFDTKAMADAVRATGKLHPDQVNGVVRQALETLKTTGNPAKALEYELPGFQPQFEAAINAASPKTSAIESPMIRPSSEVPRGPEVPVEPIAPAGPVPTGREQPVATPGIPVGSRSLAEAQSAATRAVQDAYVPTGLPVKPQFIPGHGYFVPSPIGFVQRDAADYMAGARLPYTPPRMYLPVDTQRAARIADAYAQMPHAPTDPRVVAAYDQMIKETNAQFEQILKRGLNIDFIKPGAPDPYALSPRLAQADVINNKHLWVFPTDVGFGTGVSAADQIHPLLAGTPYNIKGYPLRANDVFRIVHDYFGHLKDGNGFRAPGEEHAWRSHSSMYTPLARQAMTAETRGQNSWLNYGPHGELNRTAKTADTIFAEQKAGLIPEWVAEEGRLDPVRTGNLPSEMILGANRPDKRAAALIAATNAKQQPLVSETGLAIQSPAFAKASKAALDEITAGPKGAGPLDLSSAAQIPSVPQVPMERYVPPRGISPRLQDAIANQSVVRGIERSILAGQKLGADKWYHTEPIRRAFVDELGPLKGQKAFSTYMDMVAATSPRSNVPTNIRNASFYYQHALNKSDLPERLPYPYGHVAQVLHRQNFETLMKNQLRPLSADVPASAPMTAFDIFKNPKPASFSQNLQGNLMPGTIDTHAFRNIAMRSGDERFLQATQNKYKFGLDPKVDSFVSKYGDVRGDVVRFDPKKLIDDGKLTLEEAKKYPIFWAMQPNPNEYGAAEALFHRLGKKLDLPTADAQAAAWAGAGKLTGLGTAPTHTFPELFNERILYTAKIRGENPQSTLRDFIRGKKPLLALPPVAAAPIMMPKEETGMKDGGVAVALSVARAVKRANGGPAPTPWFVRNEARGMMHTGPIMSAVPGRTDRHNMKVAAGSYVVPAQAVSHLGQNNTMAGMAVLNKMFASGPYGNPAMKITHGRGAPKLTGHRADGGVVGEGEPVDVVTAGGEYVIPPEMVAEIGGGDVDLGHKILDKWMLDIQKDHERTIRNLPPPAKK